MSQLSSQFFMGSSCLMSMLEIIAGCEPEHGTRNQGSIKAQ